LRSFPFLQVPAEEQNVAHSINITEDTLNSDSARGIGNLLESTVNNISSQVYSNVPREINPEISMPRRKKMKHKIHRKKNHVSCNESSDNLQVQYMLYIINFADFYIASAWSPKSDCFLARKLLHCLSSEFLRRWCTYEWFYSAVDFLWFMDNRVCKVLKSSIFEAYFKAG